MAMWPPKISTKLRDQDSAPMPNKVLADFANAHGADALAYALNGLFPPSLAGVQHAPHMVSAGVSQGPSSPTSTKLCSMLCMRMHFPEGQKLPMDFMEAHLSRDTVFVFIIHNGSPAVIEDEWNMFPSDTLITKLRLLLG